MAEECDENDYHLDLDSYKPVQPLKIDHGVALFPVAAPHTGMDLHLLQVCCATFCRQMYVSYGNVDIVSKWESFAPSISLNNYDNINNIFTNLYTYLIYISWSHYNFYFKNRYELQYNLKRMTQETFSPIIIKSFFKLHPVVIWLKCYPIRKKTFSKFIK